MDPAIGFLSLATLALFSSFLTALEIAVASLGRVRISAFIKEHPSHKMFLQGLLEKPSLYLSALAFWRDLSMVACALIALSLVRGLLSVTSWLAALISLALIAAFVILFREIFPRYVGREQMGSVVVQFLGLIHLVTAPIVPVISLTQRLGNFVRKALGFRLQGEKRTGLVVSEDQIKFLLEAAEEHGLLDKQEQRMIKKIMSYDDRVARQVMVPRPEVIAIPADSPMEKVREIVQVHGHSRYPVYEGTRDNVVGVLYAKDLLKRGFSDTITLKDLVRQAYFTPTIKPINDLLREFQRSKRHMAIVVDEFGSMAGIVTLEDILEEIVGEITDEHDQPETPIRKVSKNEYLVDGDTEVGQINEELQLSLPMEEAVTIGGLITQQLEEIPRPGRSVVIDGVTLKVESATARGILSVRIHLPDAVPTSAS